MKRALLCAVGLALLAAAPADAQEGPLVRLDTLRVSVASRTSAAFPARSRVVQVLTAAQLRALPVRSIADALRWMTAADVQPRSAAQADLSVRGSTFEQVLVLVNGVRMSDPQTGHFDLDLAVPIDRVERIELLEGPASALYGADAMGGVINVVTHEGGTRVAVHGERGWVEAPSATPDSSFGSWRAAASVDGSVAGVRGGASVEWDDSDGHRLGTDLDALLLHGRLSAPTMGGRLFAEAGRASRDFGANGFYAPRDSYEETRTTTVSAGWSGEVGGGLTVHPLLSFRRHDDDFILIRANRSVYENVHRSRQRGGELIVRRPAVGGRGLVLALGAELYRDDLESFSRATGRPALGDRAEDRAAGFVETGWSDARASVSAGLRADWHDGFGDAWSPSLSASYDLTPSVRARGGWARSFRAPTWTERYYTDPSSIGDPNLKAERSWTAELGADVALPRSGVLRATVFRRQSDDLIDWVRPVGSPATQPQTVRNFQGARFDGLELGLEALRVAGFDLSASGSWLSFEADGADAWIGRYALRPLTSRVLVGAARSLGEWVTLSAHWQRQDRRADDQDPYQLLSARATVHLPKGELDLIGSNLGDERYNEFPNNPAPRRALTVGYRVSVAR